LQLKRITTDNLAQSMRAAYPELGSIEAAADAPVHLVGGAVRELLLGRGRSSNLDLVVEGDALRLAEKLGGEVLEHERFGTATVLLGELEVDLAAARTESYPDPGALPAISPGATIEADLARRDFTVNAIAVPLADPVPLDPHAGIEDLERGELRVMHRQSFVDDPTRALRAARYASRLGFSLEPATAELLVRTDLGSVSEDRRNAELLRLAAEPNVGRGLELLSAWGLVEPAPQGVELAPRVAALLAGPPWEGLAPRAPTVLRAALDPGGQELAEARPESPSAAVELAAGRDPEELVIARALGAAWLDRWASEWRLVRLEIDGGDLIAAGLEEGPALGRGLAGALRLKLDGELAPGREAELAAALAAAGAPASPTGGSADGLA
jgi:tRNA nucleotidyltransferase (CCA-adding enzyme)